MRACISNQLGITRPICVSYNFVLSNKSPTHDHTISNYTGMDKTNVKNKENSLNHEEDIKFPDVTNTLRDSYMLLDALHKEVDGLKLEEVQFDNTIKKLMEKLGKAECHLSTLAGECQERAIQKEMMVRVVKIGDGKMKALRQETDDIHGQLVKEKELQVIRLHMFEATMQKVTKKFTSGPKVYAEAILEDQITESKSRIVKNEQMKALYKKEFLDTKSKFSALVEKPAEVQSKLKYVLGCLQHQISEENKEMDGLAEGQKKLANVLDTVTNSAKGSQCQNLPVWKLKGSQLQNLPS